MTKWKVMACTFGIIMEPPMKVIGKTVKEKAKEFGKEGVLCIVGHGGQENPREKEFKSMTLGVVMRVIFWRVKSMGKALSTLAMEISISGNMLTESHLVKENTFGAIKMFMKEIFGMV